MNFDLVCILLVSDHLDYGSPNPMASGFFFILGLPYNHFSNNCDCLCRHLQMVFVLFSSHFLAFAGYSHSYKSHTENPAVSQSTDFNTLRSLSGKPAIIYLHNNTLLMKCFIHIEHGLWLTKGEWSEM